MQKQEKYQEELYEYFNRIANYVIEDLPDVWTDFCIGCMYDQKESREFFIYVSDDRGRTWNDYMDVVFESDDIMMGIFDMQDECTEMRDFCAENGSCWSCFTLRVKNDGKFDADFSYDAIPEVSEYLRRVWRGKNLKC